MRAHSPILVLVASFLTTIKSFAPTSRSGLHHPRRRLNCPRLTGSTIRRTERLNSHDESDSNESNASMPTWNPLRLAVLRLGLTEPMGTSPLNYGKYDGRFMCAYCGHLLFNSNAKYDSGSGWPSFWRSAQEDSIAYVRDWERMECRCAKCQSHLGHVFLDGPRPTAVDQGQLLARPPTDPRGSSNGSLLPRFCINGAALKYEKRSKESK